jgi:hypothetical protein
MKKSLSKKSSDTIPLKQEQNKTKQKQKPLSIGFTQ